MWRRIRWWHLLILLLVFVGYRLLRYSTLLDIEVEKLAEEVESANLSLQPVDTLALRPLLTSREYRAAREVVSYRNEQGELKQYHPKQYADWTNSIKTPRFTLRGILLVDEQANRGRNYRVQLRTYAPNQHLIDTLTFACWWDSDSGYDTHCAGTLAVDRLLGDTLVYRTTTNRRVDSKRVQNFPWDDEPGETTTRESFRLTTNGRFERR